jgi:hypothetical protein
MIIDMTIHWKALKEYFLMVPLVFLIQPSSREKCIKCILTLHLGVIQKAGHKADEAILSSSGTLKTHSDIFSRPEQYLFPHFCKRNVHNKHSEAKKTLGDCEDELVLNTLVILIGFICWQVFLFENIWDTAGDLTPSVCTAKRESMAHFV